MIKISSISKLLVIIAILAAYVTIVFAASGTDPFSGNNVCDISDKAPGDGTQNQNGSCVSTVMGEIPDAKHMVSTVILFPKNNDVIEANTTFTIRTKTKNLKAGFFDDPAKQYYIFPQTLDENGIIQGHSHVTVQKIEDEDEPLDPTIFAFFKGLNDPADGKGELTALVDKGLPAGNYRLCTMVSSFAHQPVLMPVAQRGKYLINQNLKVIMIRS
jgi:hypothetical protein